ncbi:hypothetical protein H5410_002896, partial [Solanum commersonii]
MLKIKEVVEHNMWWEPQGGTSSNFFDNRSTLVQMFQHHSEVLGSRSLTDIGIFLKEYGWDIDTMNDLFPNNNFDHVKFTVSNIKQSDQEDRPWWTITSFGKFTMKYVWNLLRNRDDASNDFKRLWGLVSQSSCQRYSGLLEERYLSFMVVGIIGPWVEVKQTMQKGLDAEDNVRLKMVFQALSNIILWFIWKRRNTILYG